MEPGTRTPKHNDIVLTTHRFPDQELSVVRAQVDDSTIRLVFAQSDIVYAIPAHQLKLVDYGTRWVFEDDIESAKAFRVQVALG